MTVPSRKMYPATLITMAAIAVGQLWYFYKRGWFGSSETRVGVSRRRRLAIAVEPSVATPMAYIFCPRSVRPERGRTSEHLTQELSISARYNEREPGQRIITLRHQFDYSSRVDCSTLVRIGRGATDAR